MKCVHVEKLNKLLSSFYFFSSLRICRVSRMALALTFVFMTAWVFEARFCPTLLNKIKKTKLQCTQNPKLA